MNARVLRITLRILAIIIQLLWLFTIVGTSNPNFRNTNSLGDDQKYGEVSEGRNLPNIVFVLADDMGYNDIGYNAVNGLSAIRTPVLDKLAEEGVKLDNYYVQPRCSPTRSQLMLGRYQIHTGLQSSVMLVGDDRCLPVAETSLPDRLQSLGYNTSMIGKWHLGMSHSDCLPTRWGFQLFFGFLIGKHDYYTHTTTTTRNGLLDPGYDLYENETPIGPRYRGIHATQLLTSKAEKVIENHDLVKPLFLYLAYQAPHEPLQAPKQYTNLFNEKIHDPDRRTYAGMIAMLDEGVHNVTKALKRKGMWENTIFIFSSDNGAAYCCGSNWPFRGGKNTFWEGGIKSPAFVHSPLLPAHIEGTISKQLMHVSDWYPTLVEGIAGGDAVASGKQLDGFNMWPSISNGLPSLRDEILINIDPSRSLATLSFVDLVVFGFHPHPFRTFDPRKSAAIIKGEWKLITGTRDIGASDLWHPPPESGLTTTDRTSCSSSNDAIQLYNLRIDPMETCNVASWPWAFNIVWDMMDRLKEYEESSVPAIPLGLDVRSNPSLHGGIWRPWLDDLI